MRRRVPAWAPSAAVLLLALAVAAVCVRWGTNVAGGSDSYGYVSQARAWLAGGPPIAEPLVRLIGVRDAARVASPLGWRPAAHLGELVPIYPPGLPWLMAAAMAVAGPSGAFLIVPLCAVAAVFGTFLLARTLAPTPAAMWAAALVAASPTFLYQAVQPMSDVPVTALWTASLVALAPGTRRSWPIAGALAGLAIVVRPNLAPLALAAAAWGLAGRREGYAPGVRALALRVLSFMLPACAAVAGIAWLQARWYGSPMASGYGTADALFSMARVPTNALLYANWSFETHPVLLVLAAAAAVSWALARGWPAPAGPSMALALFAASVAALYLPYITFDEWTYTRFLLPALPPAAALSVAAIAGAARHRRVPAVPAAFVALASVVASLVIAHDRGAFALRGAEAKYPEAARVVREFLPPGSVVLAKQHSGSVRLYAGRPTLRWDVLRPADLDPLTARLHDLGYGVYAVLDPDERREFASRFADTPVFRERRFGRVFTTKQAVEVLAILP